jgi:hypothetical protein
VVILLKILGATLQDILVLANMFPGFLFARYIHDLYS